VRSYPTGGVRSRRERLDVEMSVVLQYILLLRFHTAHLSTLGHTMSADSNGSSNIVRNRKARHDYEIIDTVEAGLVLQGTEVKSLRGRRCNLKDSHARVRDGEMWLFGVHISPYEQGNRNNHDPERPRKLLLHRREIARLKSGIDERGLTLVPLSMYFKRGKAKVELALAKGKAEYDKRAVIVERENQRNIARALKEY